VQPQVVLIQECGLRKGSSGLEETVGSWVGAAVGEYHTVMWTEAGDLFTFGYGGDGQLGGGAQNEAVPRLVEAPVVPMPAKALKEARPWRASRAFARRFRAVAPTRPLRAARSCTRRTAGKTGAL